MNIFRLSTGCGWFVVILSLGVLSGWHFDLPILRSLIPNAPETTPLTAVLLLLLGLALLAARQIVMGQWVARFVWACWSVVGGALLAVLWTGWQYIFGLGPSIELILYRQQILDHGGTFPGRPSPHTTLTCLVIGLAIGLSPLSSQRWQRTALGLSLAGLIIPWLALFGYASLTNPFYAVPGSPETGMSPLTALGFLALGIGVMGLRPTQGLMSLLTAASSGGQIVRIMLPVTALVPLLFGWVAVYGSDSGWFDATFGYALNWGVTSLLFAGLVIWKGFILHHRDVRLQQTAQERESMLAELQQAAEHISRINMELERKAEALEQSNHELRQLTHIASHDLQTPLRSISGFVQLLQRAYQDRLDQQANEWINQTVDSVRQMDAMIRDIATYSQVDSRVRPFAPIDLADLFDEVLKSLATSISDSNARVTRDDLPTVRGDSVQLRLLLQNLLDNGLKYRGAEPPRIHVSAENKEAEWMISVRDNGIGIEPEYNQRIFEIFRRLHSQQDYPGTGIGLAICRRVVQRHGGKIWVESEPGQGSMFYFTLPANGLEPA